MRTPRALSLVTAAVLAIGLTACSTPAAQSDEPDAGAAADPGFPVTVEHAYGKTVVPEKPERVATLAWANHEVPLALGIVPVGMSRATWGDDDDDGVLPWVEDALDELDADTPVLFDDATDIDYEAVADTDPDVILAAYSGLTKEQYETLSKIAPVVAYPDVAWGTSYEDMIRMNSRALGMQDEGEALIDDLHARVDESLAAHPALEGEKVLFAYLDPNDFSQIGYYTAADTRPGFLHDIGLPLPAIVEKNADSDQFYLTASAEKAEEFDDVDLFVTYGGDDLIAQLQADPLLSKIPAIAEGRVAILPDATPIAAMANPTPLSIPWGIDEYFDILEAPLKGE